MSNKNIQLPLTEQTARFGRRDFLMAAGAICATSATGCPPPVPTNPTACDAAIRVSDAGACNASDIDVGPLTNFPVGTLTYVASQMLIVGRDADGLFAYDGLCPHFAYPLDQIRDGLIYCSNRNPEHNGVYNASGFRVTGPQDMQSAKLRAFAVRVCNGNVVVSRQTRVDTCNRTTT